MNLDPFEGVLGLDIESASACSIKNGAWAYSQHPSTRVLCVCLGYAAKKGAPYLFYDWTPGANAPLPREFSDYIRAGGRLLAHNAGFEKSIWANILGKHYGWPETDLQQWRDSQAQGLAVNLPMALEGLAKTLGCPTQKDMEGAALMKEMAVAEPDDFGGWDYEMDPGKLARLILYCRRDVAATLDAHFRLPPLPVMEQRVFVVDQKINARGVWLDQDFAAKCERLARARAIKLADETFAATGGELLNATSTPAVKAWLLRLGVKLPTVTKKSEVTGVTKTAVTADKNAIISVLKREDLPAEVRTVLAARGEANKVTSLAKLKRVPLMVGDDGRLRFSLHFHGALTGRWTSSGLQLHNLPRSRMDEGESGLVRTLIDLEDLDGLETFQGNVLDSISQSLRSVLAAPPGRELIAADYSAIEARVIAWLAGQFDLLQRFTDKDAGKGEDVYVYAARMIGSKSRQLGKVCCIAEGSQVLTDRGLFPIESVPLDARVWDGVDWVSHDGPIFQGVREVVHHDGLTATPDHVVWRSDETKSTFGECADEEIPLAQTGSGRLAVRLGQGDFTARDVARSVALCEDQVHRMQQGAFAEPGQLDIGQVERVSVLFAAAERSEVARPPDDRSEAPLPEPVEPGVQALRRSRHRVPLRLGAGSLPVGSAAPWSSEGSGDRSSRQRWALREGQPAVGDTVPAEQEPPVVARVWDLLNCGPRSRFTVNGKLVSNCLALGYGMGALKFAAKVAEVGIAMPLKEARRIQKLWRERIDRIVNFWEDLEDAARDAIGSPGKAFSAGDGGKIVAMVKNSVLYLRLPSGRCIRYYRPKIVPCVKKLDTVDDDGNIVTKEMHTQEIRFFTMGKDKSSMVLESTYGGKLCVAAGTPVLTDRGWVALEDVRRSDLVHDGVEFVQHEGLIDKGVQQCVTVDGVWMTPDHEVLTNEGWRPASSKPEPYRPTFRGLASPEAVALGWQKVALELPLRLRRDVREVWNRREQGSEARHVSKLWLPARHEAQVAASRHVRASGLRRVAFDAGPVSTSDASSMAQLWRPRHSSLRTVGEVRSVLGGYGSELSQGARDRAQEQRSRLLRRQLPVGDSRRASQQPAQLNLHRHAEWAHDGSGCVSLLGDRGDHDSVSHRARLAEQQVADPTKLHESRVYDLVNCGPRRRFVVRGATGPVILSNCENVTQAVARDLLGEAAVRLDQVPPYDEIVAHVHDSIVSEVDQGAGSVDEYCAIMRQSPPWGKGLPIGVEGYRGQRFEG